MAGDSQVNAKPRAEPTRNLPPRQFPSFPYNPAVFEGDAELPCPRLTIQADLPADPQAELGLRSLPAKPGVFALDDADGRTVLLAVTADLRRLVRSRLSDAGGKTEDGRPTRRVDYRSVTKSVRAVTVGSAFESEWAYLQLARRCMAASYRGTLDRWRGWFVHCDPQADFPRWVKTNRPAAAGAKGVYLGPMPDKHAAQRYLEMLQSAFDLCRHHSILVQAPNATACAYKEMGKCPAPCDGSVTMDSYREQMREAAEFGSSPSQRWREKSQRAMAEAAQRMDYETAERCRQKLEATEPALKKKFAHVDRLERFRFLAVMPSEQPDRARLFVVRGGWIAPVVDVAFDIRAEELSEVVDALNQMMHQPAADLTDEAVENIGLVCRHLFRPKGAKQSGLFLRCADGVDVDDIAGGLRTLARKTSPEDAGGEISESSLEG